MTTPSDKAGKDMVPWTELIGQEEYQSEIDELEKAGNVKPPKEKPKK